MIMQDDLETEEYRDARHTIYVLATVAPASLNALPLYPCQVRSKGA